MEEQGSFELDKYHMVSGETQYLGQTMLQKNVKVIKLLLDFDSTSSCVALRAADLGLSGQDAFQTRTFGHFPAKLPWTG